MRITFGMMSQQVVDDLMSSSDKLVEAQTRASTGRQINKPSDDPVGTAQAMSLNSSISELDQMSRNSDSVKNLLGLTDDALASVTSQLNTARDLAMQAIDPAMSDAGREGIVAQLDQIARQLADTANTQYGGEYIFGGNRTHSQPIGPNTSGDNPYIYHGDTGVHSVAIAPGISVAANVPASAIFNMDGAVAGVMDVFTLVRSLAVEVRAGDTESVSNRISNIDANLANVNTIRAQVGARIDRIGTTADQLAGAKQNMSELLSKTEDADLSQAVIDLQARQNAYQAAIAVAQRLFSTSLADYFK